MSAFILSLYARKGGVGRTMLTQNLAGACAELGGSVLVVDTDSQASVSKNFLTPTTVERLRPYETIAALFDDSSEPDPTYLIHPTGVENISILPASDHFERFDRPVLDEERELTFGLRDFLQDVVDRFDIVLIDTPPNVSNLPAWSALMASHHVVTPVQPEKNSSEAIIDVKRRLARAMANGNPDLCDLGYFLNMYNGRLALHKVQRSQIEQLYGEQVFDTVIKLRTLYKEAVFTGKPITHARPRSDEAKMMRTLLEEILERVRRHWHRGDAGSAQQSKTLVTEKPKTRVNE